MNKYILSSDFSTSRISDVTPFMDMSMFTEGRQDGEVESESRVESETDFVSESRVENDFVSKRKVEREVVRRNDKKVIKIVSEDYSVEKEDDIIIIESLVPRIIRLGDPRDKKSVKIKCLKTVGYHKIMVNDVKKEKIDKCAEYIRLSGYENVKLVPFDNNWYAV